MKPRSGSGLWSWMGRFRDSGQDTQSGIWELVALCRHTQLLSSSFSTDGGGWKASMGIIRGVIPKKRKVGVLEKSFCLYQRIVHTLAASASCVYAYTCSTSDFIPISAYLPHIRYTPIYPFSDTAFDLTYNLNLHLLPAAVIHVSIYPTHACYLPGLIHMWHGTHGTQYMYVRRPS